MKKLLVCLCLMLCITAVHTVLADNVVSRPVGVIKVELAPGENTFLSIPFAAADNTVQSIFAGQLADVPCIIRKWDKVNQVFIDAGLDSDMTLDPGEGFILQNQSAEAQVVYLAGAVVLDDEATVGLVQGLNLIAFPYSSVGLQANIGLASSGDLLAGVGYWYEKATVGAEDWNEFRPYANQFPATGNPAIENIAVAGDEITLTVITAGAAGEELDVLNKDVAIDEELVTEGGWVLAANNIIVAGMETVRINPPRPSVDGHPSRHRQRLRRTSQGGDFLCCFASKKRVKRFRSPLRFQVSALSPSLPLP